MEGETMISIFIKNITPHPDNPRKDLGDLTELAASIRARGILQNLTVVRRGDEKDFLFTCVIGHRRLAAAKLAGLDTVPCTVSDMDKHEQLATMLLENMQRADLTLMEQASGFQMMMNLGDSVSDVSWLTGLSETTVRRRVRLLELDRAKLEKGLKNGATLSDFAELEKIQDIALRNKALESIGTSNFKWAVKSAMETELCNARKPAWIAKAESFAKQMTGDCYANGFKTFLITDAPGSMEIPEDAQTRAYGYQIYGNRLTLYVQREPAQNKDSERENALRTLVNAALEDARQKSRQFYELRFEFVKQVSGAAVKKNLRSVMEYLIKDGIHQGIEEDGSGFDLDSLVELLNIEPDENGDIEEYTELFPELEALRQFADAPEKTFLAAIYCLSGDNKSNGFWGTYYKKDFPLHVENKQLSLLYELLCALGYAMSDEERQMMDGTHPVLNLNEIKEEDEA